MINIVYKTVWCDGIEKEKADEVKEILKTYKTRVPIELKMGINNGSITVYSEELVQPDYLVHPVWTGMLKNDLGKLIVRE